MLEIGSAQSERHSRPFLGFMGDVLMPLLSLTAHLVCYRPEPKSAACRSTLFPDICYVHTLYTDMTSSDRPHRFVVRMLQYQRTDDTQIRRTHRGAFPSQPLGVIIVTIITDPDRNHGGLSSERFRADQEVRPRADGREVIQRRLARVGFRVTPVDPVIPVDFLALLFSFRSSTDTTMRPIHTIGASVIGIFVGDAAELNHQLSWAGRLSISVEGGTVGLSAPDLLGRSLLFFSRRCVRASSPREHNLEGIDRWHLQFCLTATQGRLYLLVWRTCPIGPNEICTTVFQLAAHTKRDL